MLVPPILVLATIVTALPFQNTTVPDTVGWTSAPQVRGTFDLLLSCLTTLFLCAWTAYHPNVVANTGEWRKLAKRVLWMGIAVLVPEVVLWCAWEQWWTSRRLVQVVDALGQKAFDGVGGDVVAWGDEGNIQEDCMGCKVSGEGRGSGDYGLERLFSETSTGYEGPSTAIEDLQKTSPSKLGRSYVPRFRFRKNKANGKQDAEVPQKTPIWTKEEAFFALSGGYAVSSSSFHPSSYLTLTPTALLFLARLGLLPNTPRITISDKSKADYVAKILVCIQAGWFLLQCVARLVKGLPLTLLELHVLAHVGCTFVMYVLWIEKPYDVGAPVLVEDERVRDLVAFWAVDDGSASSQPEHVGDKYECAIDGMISLEQVRTAHRNAQAHSTSRSRYGRMIKNYMLNNLEEIRIFRNTKRINSERDTPEPATSKQLTHLTYANAALSYLKSRQTHFTYVSKNPPASTCSSTSSSTSDHNTLRTPAIRLPVPHVVPVRSNLLIDGLPSIRRDDLRGTQVSKAAETYAVLSALYGGLHLAGWGFKFASEIERWCWRSSGLAMVAAPLGTVMIVWSLSAHEWSYRTLRKRSPAPSVCKSDGDEGKDGASMTPQLPSSTHSRPPNPSKSTSLLTHLNVFFRRACRHILSTAISFIMYPSLMAAGLGWTLYPFARLYVLVEVFAALRASDPDVYKTVEWADWIPHFG